MANSLYITATEAKSGKAIIALGVMQALLARGEKTAFFRPIINESEKRDPDLDLILSQTRLDMPYEDTYAYTLTEARKLLSAGDQDTLLEGVLRKVKYLTEKYDFILYEGTDFSGKNAAFELELNALLAENLNAPLLVVAPALEKNSEDTVANTQLTLDMLQKKGLDIAACIVTHVQDAPAVSKALTSRPHKDISYKAYALPADPAFCSKASDSSDTATINTSLAIFTSQVNGTELVAKIQGMESHKVTPKIFEFNLLQRASSHKMRIVLPESSDERILYATDILLRRKVADIILIGDPESVKGKATELGLNLDGATIIDPAHYDKRTEYAETYCEARKKRSLTLEQAQETMLNPTYFSTMMVHKGDADGMVSGAIHTTADTIRPAFEFIKTKPGASIVSSVFFMCLKDRVLVFGDCAVNPNPIPSQVADIAISSAATAKVFGVEPRIAMLSYSTGTSGKGPDVSKVIEATALAKERAPELMIEGPLQYDAAIDPDVARTKLPNSPVAGKATVFIFPDLNTGNNTYKAVQRAANAVAVGPVLQGLNKPVNDLSRGCTVADIINTVAITAVQAQADKGLA